MTYLGAVWGTRAALTRMKPRDRGVIVQVGSALAYRSIPLQSPYCGAKAALRGFTDSLRSELIHDGSRVHLTMVHLAAFNTPQFDWGKTCMDGAPRPLGKIFQPEVAAEAIYWSSQHRRRELWVGFPAVLAILGTRVLPGFLDRKLAYQAYEGQLEAASRSQPDRRDNLHAPVPGDHGAHGRFDERALSHSAQAWLVTRRWVWVARGVAAAGSCSASRSRLDHSHDVAIPAGVALAHRAPRQASAISAAPQSTDAADLHARRVVSEGRDEQRRAEERR